MTQEFDFDSNLFDHFSELFAETQPNPLNDVPYVIGMMSGTSLDGLDAVICEFNELNEDNDEPVTLIASHHLPFPADLREALLALTQPNGVSDFIDQHKLAFQSELDVFGWASVFYAEFASQGVNELLEKSGVAPDEVSAIGCHGQTVRHRPEWQFSLQLLDPNVLAERTGIAVVSDFRRRDIAVGGQGAPLVPAFHQAIFGNNTLDHSLNEGSSRCILNLGGIANVTILKNDENVIGFDTGVANLLLDAWCQKHTAHAFDKDGDWAKTGQINEALLTELLAHPFFARPAPKSTGREEFNLDWLEQVLLKFEQTHNAPQHPADVQATLVELTAKSVAEAIRPHFSLGKNTVAKPDLLVCGGGALNGLILQRLQANLPDFSVTTTQKMGVSPLWVEAMAFAWLARQTLLNLPSNLPSVTGASKAVVLGQVCF